MRAIILSDLHYGFSSRTRKIHERFVDLVAKKISEHNAEIVIITGDTASTRQKEIDKFFKLLRSKVSIRVVVVWGNHDYWDDDYRTQSKARVRTMGELFQLHKKICEQYDLHYLGDGDLILGDYQICGYDGWYHDVDPGTNDLRPGRMLSFVESAPTHSYMNYRAHKDCERILESATNSQSKIKILVSHFDCVEHEYFGSRHRGDPSHLDALSKIFDFIIYGHTHRRINEPINKARVLSPGGDYDHPVGLIVDFAKNEVIGDFKLPFTAPYRW